MFRGLFDRKARNRSTKYYAVKACIYVNGEPTQEVHLNIPAWSKKQAKEKFQETVEMRVVGAIKNRKLSKS